MSTYPKWRTPCGDLSHSYRDYVTALMKPYNRQTDGASAAAICRILLRQIKHRRCRTCNYLALTLNVCDEDEDTGGTRNSTLVLWVLHAYGTLDIAEFRVLSNSAVETGRYEVNGHRRTGDQGEAQGLDVMTDGLDSERRAERASSAHIPAGGRPTSPAPATATVGAAAVTSSCSARPGEAEFRGKLLDSITLIHFTMRHVISE
ncbi:hypothetical protein J6590_012716 [Homalodisca vitripennis]|nr:hypothetical protein J6590_012716 [Homalodisca vitripennis]